MFKISKECKISKIGLKVGEKKTNFYAAQSFHVISWLAIKLWRINLKRKNQVPVKKLQAEQSQYISCLTSFTIIEFRHSVYPKNS